KADDKTSIFFRLNIRFFLSEKFSTFGRPMIKHPFFRLNISLPLRKIFNIRRPMQKRSFFSPKHPFVCQKNLRSSKAGVVVRKILRRPKAGFAFPKILRRSKAGFAFPNNLRRSKADVFESSAGIGPGDESLANNFQEIPPNVRKRLPIDFR